MSISRRDTEGKKTRWRSIRLLVLMALLSALCTPLRVLADSVKVIVNPAQASVPLDRPLLRAIFSMRMRQWSDGTPVHVFVMPDRDETTALFCREELGTFPYVMRSTWDRMVFTGTGLAPTVVASEREMRERVRATPGAIGYVRSADTSDQRRFLPRLLFAGLPGDPHG
jgi:ABC-type phosphate transport system substrate-binding protein